MWFKGAVVYEVILVQLILGITPQKKKLILSMSCTEIELVLAQPSQHISIEEVIVLVQLILGMSCI